LKELLVIVNPAAGRGRGGRSWPPVRKRLEEAKVEFDEAFTSRSGEGFSIAEQAAGDYRCIAAAGGDGTVHEVVNGLMRAGAKAGLAVIPAFAVIPLGSGDDFAKLLAPGDPVDRLRNPKPRRFDIGRIRSGLETRYFANGMDIGFGAHGARNVSSVPGFLTGLAAYLGALALTLVRYPLLNVRLQLDEARPFQLTTAMTAAMNGTTFGGSFRVCPDARPDDGLLDLLLVGAVGRLAILQLVPKIMRGSHAGDPRVRLLRAQRATIESEIPLLVEADGEIAFQEATRLEIDLLPAALRVFA
jgi:diacylglycerol kinase (ATP)